MIPWWALALIAVAAFAGGYLMAVGTSTPRCVVCAKQLPRVCPDGRCGGTLGSPSLPDGIPRTGAESGDWASHVDRALAIGGAG